MQSDDSRASSSLSSASSSSSSSTVTSSPKTASYLLEAIDKQGKHALHYIDNLLGNQGSNSAKTKHIVALLGKITYALETRSQFSRDNISHMITLLSHIITTVSKGSSLESLSVIFQAFVRTIKASSLKPVVGAGKGEREVGGEKEEGRTLLMVTEEDAATITDITENGTMAPHKSKHDNLMLPTAPHSRKHNGLRQQVKEFTARSPWTGEFGFWSGPNYLNASCADGRSSKTTAIIWKPLDSIDTEKATSAAAVKMRNRNNRNIQDQKISVVCALDIVHSYHESKSKVVDGAEAVGKDDEIVEAATADQNAGLSGGISSFLRHDRRTSRMLVMQRLKSNSSMVLGEQVEGGDAYNFTSAKGSPQMKGRSTRLSNGHRFGSSRFGSSSRSSLSRTGSMHRMSTTDEKGRSESIVTLKLLEGPSNSYPYRYSTSMDELHTINALHPSEIVSSQKAAKQLYKWLCSLLPLIAGAKHEAQTLASLNSKEVGNHLTIHFSVISLAFREVVSEVVKTLSLKHLSPTLLMLWGKYLNVLHIALIQQATLQTQRKVRREMNVKCGEYLHEIAFLRNRSVQILNESYKIVTIERSLRDTLAHMKICLFNFKYKLSEIIDLTRAGAEKASEYFDKLLHDMVKEIDNLPASLLVRYRFSKLQGSLGAVKHLMASILMYQEKRSSNSKQTRMVTERLRHYEMLMKKLEKKKRSEFKLRIPPTLVSAIPNRIKSSDVYDPPLKALFNLHDAPAWYKPTHTMAKKSAELLVNILFDGMLPLLWSKSPADPVKLCIDTLSHKFGNPFVKCILKDLNRFLEVENNLGVSSSKASLTFQHFSYFSGLIHATTNDDFGDLTELKVYLELRLVLLCEAFPVENGKEFYSPVNYVFPLHKSSHFFSNLPTLGSYYVTYENSLSLARLVFMTQNCSEERIAMLEGKLNAMCRIHGIFINKKTGDVINDGAGATLVLPLNFVVDFIIDMKNEIKSWVTFVRGNIKLFYDSKVKTIDNFTFANFQELVKLQSAGAVSIMDNIRAYKHALHTTVVQAETSITMHSLDRTNELKVAYPSFEAVIASLDDYGYLSPSFIHDTEIRKLANARRSSTETSNFKSVRVLGKFMRKNRTSTVINAAQIPQVSDVLSDVPKVKQIVFNRQDIVQTVSVIKKPRNDEFLLRFSGPSFSFLDHVLGICTNRYVEMRKAARGLIEQIHMMELTGKISHENGDKITKSLSQELSSIEAKMDSFKKSLIVRNDVASCWTVCKELQGQLIAIDEIIVMFTPEE